MASTPTRLMSFAEFEQIAEPAGVRHELRHGELFAVAPPQNPHFIVQQTLRDLLDAAAAGAGRVFTEVGFRPLPDHEFRIADVAFLTREQWAAAKTERYMRGAPAMVVEILSPSNTLSEMLDKEQLCLDHGCREFWLVDLDRAQIKVSTPDGHTIAYKRGQQIPLLFGGGLAVDDVFAEAPETSR